MSPAILTIESKLIFFRFSFTQTGVVVDLDSGIGSQADAEGDRYFNIENVYGTQYDDDLTGTDEDNIIEAYGGNDIITPMGGNDLLSGGSGDNKYVLNQDASGIKEIVIDFESDGQDILEMKDSNINEVCGLILNEDIYLKTSSNPVMTVKLYEMFRNENRFVYMDLASGFLNGKELDFANRTKASVCVSESTLRISAKTTRTASFRLITNDETCQSELFRDRRSNPRLKVHIKPDDGGPMREFNLSGFGRTSRIGDLGTASVFSAIAVYSVCDIELASSNMLVERTLPPPPEIKRITPYSQDIHLEWNAPDLTSPKARKMMVFDILIFDQDNSNNWREVRTHRSVVGNSIFIHNLSPDTTYKVQICTVVGFEESEFVDSQPIQLDGNNDIQCDGDPPPSPPTCEMIPCTMPADISEMFYEPCQPDSSVLSCSCQEGYELSMGTTSFTSTCKNGHWFPQMVACTQAPQCENPDVQANVKLHGNVPSEYRLETVLHLACDNHAALTGPRTITCDGHHWIPKTRDVSPSLTTCGK